MTRHRLTRFGILPVAVAGLVACQSVPSSNLASGARPAPEARPNVPSVGRHVLALPSNDARAAATVVSATPFVDTQDTAEATLETGETVQCFAEGGGSVWYRYTAPATAILEVSAVGSSYPVGIGLFFDSQEFPFGAGCATEEGNTVIRFPVVAGRTYEIQVAGGAEAPGGTLVLSARTTDLTFTVNPEVPIQQLSRYQTQATVKGIFRADVPVFFQGTVGLRQKVAKKYILSQDIFFELFFSPENTQATGTWSVPLRSENGTWVGGPAELTLRGSLCTLFGACESIEMVNLPVRLKSSR